MKKSLLTLLAIICVMPVFSIDTLWIEPDNYGNNYDLKATIDADQGAHIYGLRRNTYYYVDGTIDNTFPVVLIGEESPENLAPATLLYATDDQGASPNNMWEAKDDVTFKNLYLVGVDDLGTFRNFYRTEEPGVKLVMENCVCNYTNDWRGFIEFRSVEGTAILTNNIVMNMMRLDGYVWATWFHTQNTKPDTLIITNNTIFNCPNNFISLNEKEAISPNYALIEHNTVVNTAKDILHFSYWLNAYHKNNLYQDVMYQGDSKYSATGWTHRTQCPDDEPYAFTKVDTINNSAWQDSMLTTLGQDYRIFEVSNNNYFQSDRVKEIPTMVGQMLEDTVNNIYSDSGFVVQPLSPRTEAMFNDDAAFPGLMYDEASITFEDPGFTLDPTNVEDLVAHALMLYRNSQPAVNTHFDPDMETNPNGYWMTYEWPILGEGGFIDFTYSSANLADASDMGYHLGDLYHWYPGEYEMWEKGIASSNENTLASQSKLSVYPNPASNYIRFSKVSDYTIFNINGQLVKSVQQAEQMDVSTMTRGMYFVRDLDGQVAKFIVK